MRSLGPLPRKPGRRVPLAGALAVSALLALLLVPGAARAQEQPAEAPEVVRVAIRELPPFVERADDRPTGFTVELWEEVAERLGVTTEWVVVDSVDEQLAAVEDGRADVAGTAISVTQGREERVDFSYPYFESGLQVLVPGQDSVSFRGALANLWDPSVLSLLVVFAVAVVVVGLLVWLLERRHNPDFHGDGTFRGAGEGIWWAVVTVATVGYGDRVTERAASRLIAALWIMFGLVFVAQFTATVTANLTVDELASDIRGPDDLSGRQVATVAGTTADAWLDAEGIPAERFAEVGPAVDAVAEGRADAAVYDYPVLLHEVERLGEDRVTLVGAPFTFEGYAFALPRDSALRDPLDRALLGVIEDGSYQHLRRAWFPDVNG